MPKRRWRSWSLSSNCAVMDWCKRSARARNEPRSRFTNIERESTDDDDDDDDDGDDTAVVVSVDDTGGIGAIAAIVGGVVVVVVVVAGGVVVVVATMTLSSAACAGSAPSGTDRSVMMVATVLSRSSDSITADAERGGSVGAIDSRRRWFCVLVEWSSGGCWCKSAGGDIADAVDGDGGRCKLIVVSFGILCCSFSFFRCFAVVRHD